MAGTPSGGGVVMTDADARVQQLEAEVRQLREQQTATADILQAISRTPTDLQAVLDTIAESTARVCGAEYVAVWQREGEQIRVVARHGWSEDQFPRPDPR